MEIKLIKNWIAQKLANALPKRVLYYCVIRIWADLTVEVYPTKCPDEVDIFMAMEYLG